MSDDVTVDKILFEDVTQETDYKVLAEKYEKWAEHYLNDEKLAYEVYPDGMVFMHSYEFRMLQSYVRQEHDSVLDVGCGQGIQLMYWLSKGFSTAWGCDISKLMVDACHERGLPCRQVDLNQPYLMMPYLPDGFDIVTCTHVLEHVQDPAGVVKELYRIAKDLVMIVVPVGESYKSESHIHKWNTPQELVDGLGIEEHWICSLEQVISKPEDVAMGQSCYIVVIYKQLSEGP